MIQNIRRGIVDQYNFTFSRPSTAYDSRGRFLLPNNARFENGGIMVEEGMTNLIAPVSVQDFNTSSWSAYSGAVVTVTQNQTVGEWNTDKATRIQTTGGTNIVKYFRSIVVPSVNDTQYSLKVKVKNIGTTPVVVSMNLASGATTVNPGETKTVDVTGVGNGTSNFQLMFTTQNVSDSIDIYAFQPQAETKAYSTSFHEGTRAKETLTIPLSYLSPTEGTIEIKCDINAITKRQDGANSNRLIWIPRSDNTASGIQIYHSPTSATWSLSTINDAGVQTVNSFVDSLTPNGITNIAITYNSTEAKVFVGGARMGTINSPNLPSAFGTNAYIGSTTYGSYLNTTFYDVCFSSIARSDAEIASRNTIAQTTGRYPDDQYVTYKMNCDRPDAQRALRSISI
jgi:hypothetical protein